MTAFVVSTAPADAVSAPYPAPTTPAHAAPDVPPVGDGVQPENVSVVASRVSARSIATSAPIRSPLPIENSLVDVAVSVIRVPPAAATSKLSSLRHLLSYTRPCTAPTFHHVPLALASAALAVRLISRSFGAPSSAVHRCRPGHNDSRFPHFAPCHPT
ncbi:hypothetical protein JG688_00014870 [Phytophthora aleatoria]|uniref:Uncharacterized protein n=1 Tax=Phytophthora aleatoria TaxID=2496075 RepID=A0A8J5IWI1_9STRA|nr:hypothetical protein JG688_00014870 [Phytophthora aleatoria]